MRKTKLEWKERGGAWVAFAVPLELSIEIGDGELFWCFGVIGGDSEESGQTEVIEGSDSLEAAQLAAESAALQWLTEGVTALGGRVLTGDKVALCVEALKQEGALWAARNNGARSREALELARKLGGV